VRRIRYFTAVSPRQSSAPCVEADPGAESVARFIDSRDVLLNAVRVIKPGSVFLRVEGPESHGITIDGGDLSKSGSPVSVGAGAVESSVKLRT
jgi:hypothetical protein